MLTREPLHINSFEDHKRNQDTRLDLAIQAGSSPLQKLSSRKQIDFGVRLSCFIEARRLLPETMRASFGPTVWMFPMATAKNTIHYHRHENAIDVLIYSYAMQNALRRRDEQLNVCQDKRRSFKCKSNNIKEFQILIITVLQF